MAKEEIAYSISVDSGKAGKSLSDLKKEFKDSQKELSSLTTGTKEYVAQLEKLGKIKDDIGDLNNEIKAFNPEGKIKAFGNVVGGLAGGFSAAQGAVALFSNGNKDLEKTLLKVQAAMAFSQGIQGLVGLGDAFKVVGNIIKANPLFLIITIITAIGAAMFALKDKIGIVGDAFDAIGKVIGYVTDKIKQFTDWIGISTFALDKMKDSIVANNEKLIKSVEQRYDSEIAALKRAGKETELAEIRKLDAVVKANNAIIANLDAKDADDKKRIDELRSTNQKYYQDILNLSDAYHDKQDAKDKAANEKYLAELAKRKQHEKEISDLLALSAYDARDAAYTAQLEKEKEQNAQDLIEQNEAFAEASAQEVSLFEGAVKAKREISNADIEQGLSIAQQSNDSLMQLSNLLFDLKRQNLTKGSAEELKLAKKQFAINKALGITTTIINTVQGMIKAIASNPPPSPLGFIGAALTGVAGTIATAKIATQKFQGDSGGGSGGGSIPSLPSSGANAPNITPPSQGSTQLNPDGTIKTVAKTTTPIVKAIVVETEMTKTQSNVSKLEARAKL